MEHVLTSAKDDINVKSTMYCPRLVILLLDRPSLPFICAPLAFDRNCLLAVYLHMTASNAVFVLIVWSVCKNVKDDWDY